MKEAGSEERESGEEFLQRLKEDHEPRIALSTVSRHAGLLRLESQHQQLLPGLSNEIVLHLIAPKLPWREFGNLLSVSRCWKQAIQSHQVYDARVRTHCTETLLVLNHIPHLGEMAWRGFGSDDALSLYSVRDKSWLQLPPIPHRHRGLPDNSKFISLDGKIYVLGGFTGPHYLFHDDWRVNRDSREVYVLDVAGQSGWKQCASMLEPRWNFGCGVINGKIYVFGGTCRGEHTRGSEVYNSRENAWSLVAPMKSMRFGPHCNVVTVGEELFVHGGNFYGTYFDLGTYSHPLPEENESDDKLAAWFAEVYHPGRDEWKLVTPFKFRAEGGLFTAHGKIYRMTHCGIDVCHFEGDDNFWTGLHLFLDFGDEPNYVLIFATLLVNDELFALVDYPADAEGGTQTSLFRGKGFGSEDKNIVWEKQNCPLLPEQLGPPYVDHFMCPIQL